MCNHSAHSFLDTALSAAHTTNMSRKPTADAGNCMSLNDILEEYLHDFDTAAETFKAASNRRIIHWCSCNIFKDTAFSSTGQFKAYFSAARHTLSLFDRGRHTLLFHIDPLGALLIHG